MGSGTNPPRLMEQHSKIRLRAAAMKVRKLLPGPLGELVARELMIWEEFGYRLGSGSVVLGAIDQIMKTPLPEESPNPHPDSKLARERAAATSAVGY